MLASFVIQGYGLVSIILSSITLINGYVFSYFGLKDIGRLPTNQGFDEWFGVKNSSDEAAYSSYPLFAEFNFHFIIKPIQSTLNSTQRVRDGCRKNQVTIVMKR
jgi:hypothetical protein